MTVQELIGASLLFVAGAAALLPAWLDHRQRAARKSTAHSAPPRMPEPDAVPDGTMVAVLDDPSNWPTRAEFVDLARRVERIESLEAARERIR